MEGVTAKTAVIVRFTIDGGDTTATGLSRLGKHCAPITIDGDVLIRGVRKIPAGGECGGGPIVPSSQQRVQCELVVVSAHILGRTAEITIVNGTAQL